LINVVCNYIFLLLKAALIETVHNVKCIGISENAVQSYNILFIPQYFYDYYLYFCTHILL